MEKLIPMINEAGTHETGKITRKADAAIASGLLVKVGSDADHIAVNAAATTAPLGVLIQTADAAEESVSVELLSAPGTKNATASAAITAGLRIVGAAGGKVAALSATGGTYYIVGRAITGAAADGDVIEFEGCVPYAIVVS